MNDKKELIKVLEKINVICDFYNKNLTKHQYNTLDEARDILVQVLKKMED